MRLKSFLAVAAVAGLVGLLPTQAKAQPTYRGGIYVPGYPSLYYPANSYYYPGISNEPFATNYYTPRYYNYPATTNLYSWGYSGSAYAPASNAYAYTPTYYNYVNPGLRAQYNQGYNGYSMPNYNYSGYYAPNNYGGVSIGAGGSIYIPNYP
ncbi:MAG TPA: hypothetical protein VFE78_31315 [Gemmataceae bacterium]|jgi:hypothetical protein|nr:hypothetical protein [Gemmataceae bacterium]